MARKRKRSSRKKNNDLPGWVYGVFGLGVGLSVAAAVWMSDRRGAPATQPQPRQAASLEEPIASTPVPVQNYDDNGETAAAPQKSRFEFYDVLPNFEVVVPEVDTAVERDTEPRAVIEPGIYVLQAGSFTAYEDADRRRAELALQGITSNIQKVSIDDRTYHRVRIGPTSDLEELNLLRSRLRAAKIDVLRIRLGD